LEQIEVDRLDFIKQPTLLLKFMNKMAEIESRYIRSPDHLINGITENFEDLEVHESGILAGLKEKIDKRILFIDFTPAVDDMFLHTIRKYENVNTICLFGIGKHVAFHAYYKVMFKEDYILYGIKEISMKKKAVVGAFYQLLYYRHRCRVYSDYLDFLGKYLRAFKEFERMGDEEDEMKVSILIVSKRLIATDFYAIPEESAELYAMYIPRTVEEQWIAATVFLNANSLAFLEIQDLKHYLKADTRHRESWDRMDEFLQMIQTDVPIRQRHRLMFYSSTVLYQIGSRCNTDFDMMVVCDRDDPEFHRPLRENEIRANTPYKEKGEKGVYDFSYVGASAGELRRLFFEEHYDRWAQRMGLRKFEEARALGKNHQYYLGIKSTTIQFDICRREMRNRPRAVADLIALRKRYGFRINIPTPPKTKEVYHKASDLPIERYDELVKRGAKVVTKYGEEELVENVPVNQDDFIRTVIWALRDRYGMEFTQSEVMIEVGLEKNTAEKNTYKLRAAVAVKEKADGFVTSSTEASSAAPVKPSAEKPKNKIVVVKTKDAVTGEVTVTRKSSAPAAPPPSGGEKKRVMIIKKA
jgi:hypothetical protein